MAHVARGVFLIQDVVVSRIRVGGSRNPITRGAAELSPPPKIWTRRFVRRVHVMHMIFAPCLLRRPWVGPAKRAEPKPRPRTVAKAGGRREKTQRAGAEEGTRKHERTKRRQPRQKHRAASKPRAPHTKAQAPETRRERSNYTKSEFCVIGLPIAQNMLLILY